MKRQWKIGLVLSPKTTDNNAIVHEIRGNYVDHFMKWATGRRGQLLSVVLPVLLMLPFLGKALHIDDPIYIWSAKQILINPFDFYGFQANWYFTSMPVAIINQNPPLICYYLAAVGALFGWSEVALHVAMLVPTGLLGLGIYKLSEMLTPRPLLTVMVAISTPALLVSASNLMTDVPMLCFYVWAAVFWLKSYDTDSISGLPAAALCMVAACLTKYYGITMVPLLFVWSLVKNRGRWPRLFFLLAPVAALVAYSIYSKHLYDIDLFTHAAGYSDYYRSIFDLEFVPRGVTTLSFMGGCLLSLLFLTPFLWSPRHWVYGGGLIYFVITMLLMLGLLTTFNIRETLPAYTSFVLQMALFVLLGIQILLLVVLDFWANRKDPAQIADSLLLLLWVGGGFLFVLCVNWTVNGRVVLVLLPAVAILAVRRLHRVRPQGPPPRWLAPALAPACMAALAVTTADYRFASAQRTAAEEISEILADYPHRVVFQGHWGFQYYMQDYHGYEILEMDKTDLTHGDLMIVPINNVNTIIFGEGVTIQ